jgi:hypothetical protein
VGFEAQDGHGAEEDNNRQGSDERRELPETGRVIALRPMRGSGVGGEEIDQSEKEREEGCGFESERCGVEGVGGRSGAG